MSDEGRVVIYTAFDDAVDDLPVEHPVVQDAPTMSIVQRISEFSEDLPPLPDDGNPLGEVATATPGAQAVEAPAVEGQAVEDLPEWGEPIWEFEQGGWWKQMDKVASQLLTSAMQRGSASCSVQWGDGNFKWRFELDTMTQRRIENGKCVKERRIRQVKTRLPSTAPNSSSSSVESSGSQQQHQPSHELQQ